MDLFQHADKYPNHPGYKRRNTSWQAAQDMRDKAPTLREQCWQAIQDRGPMTADEVAEFLERSVLSVRPRVAELANMKMLKDSGARRENMSGKMAIVWGVA